MLEASKAKGDNIVDVDIMMEGKDIKALKAVFFRRHQFAVRPLKDPADCVVSRIRIEMITRGLSDRSLIWVKHQTHPCLLETV